MFANHLIRLHKCGIIVTRAVIQRQSIRSFKYNKMGDPADGLPLLIMLVQAHLHATASHAVPMVFRVMG